MPVITLPDGTTKTYDAPVTAAKVAADIGAGLAKAALGAKIDGVLCDLSTIMSVSYTHLTLPTKRIV